MKKILIISSGTTGKHFIQRIIEAYSSENTYYVIQAKAKVFEDASLSRFKFYEFDPTSLSKLSIILKIEFMQVYIAMDNMSELEHTIKNIRMIKKSLQIIALNTGDLQSEDSYTTLINSNEFIASKLLDYLPNVPIFAQNIGTGEGEIMEVQVPFGSSFIYRHVGAIEQKNWKISALYRKGKLILPVQNTMIHPNDILVIIGEPTILKSVYRSIKRELGQFPKPFGSNIMLYIDLNIENHKLVNKLVEKAIFMHTKFKHKLIIKIINPGNISLLEHIKEFRSFDVEIYIQYNNFNKENLFFKDIKNYNIGLLIVSAEIFAHRTTRNKFYEVHIPVLKLSEKSFKDLKDSVIILGGNTDLEKISATIFDFSEQMGFNLNIFNNKNENQNEKLQIIEHYNNLATIFSKSIKTIDEERNPIRVLREKQNFIQILPFTNKLTSRRLKSLFSTDSELLYHKLDKYHQLFIPVQI